MDVMNCKSCGSLFNYIGGLKICPKCQAKLEDKYKEVRDYIEANGRAGIEEIAKECEVSTKQIKQWVREERLVFSDDSPMTIECEKCGAPIKSGRFCKNCSNGLVNNLNSAFGIGAKQVQTEKKLSSDNKNKMRFLDN